MNHAITWGELLKILAIGIGILVALFGVATLAGSMMSDDPSAADDGSKQGCTLTIVGLVIIIGAALLLAACNEHPQALGERIVEKDIPVAVQPIKASDIPPTPPALGPRPPTAQQAADAAFAAHCRDVAFIIRAVPLLLLSAGLAPAQAPSYPECEKH